MRDKRRTLFFCFTAVLVLLGLTAPFASKSPDALEKTAADLGFVDSGKTVFLAAFRDYAVPGLGEYMSTVVASLIGMGILFFGIILIGKMIKWGSRT